jgi:hypothetical protein
MQYIKKMYMHCLVAWSTLHASLGFAFGPFFQILPPFGNIRCFSFVNEMYLDIF